MYNARLVTGDGFINVLVDDGPLRLIGLDTKETGRVSGRLCARRLGWLEAVLASAPERPTMLSMHHPPFTTGMVPFDADGFDGAGALAEILARNRQVLALVAGHQHRPVARLWAGVLACIAPSASFQFSADFAGDHMRRVLEPAALGVYHYMPESGVAAHLSYVGSWPG